MCGIAGVFTTLCAGSFERQVTDIVRRQRLRGPDFSSLEHIKGTRAEALLGHNRLSIIDLSASGNQPMWDCDHQICIVFNGEIYNYIELRQELQSLGHRFTGTSDTEVIIQAFARWGSSAFARFNGMFAFGLYDANSESLWLVRDRFGVKPLYYIHQGNAVHFASTARPLAINLGLAPDLEYLSRGVRYCLWENGEAAPYANLKALPPGQWLCLSPEHDGSIAGSRGSYYVLEDRVAELAESMTSLTDAQALVLVSDLLDDSVRLRLRSDVPVAISLSGGLDSSIVAAVAARTSRAPLRGFTFGQTHVPDSEGPAAMQFGHMTGIGIQFVWPTMREVCQLYEDTLKAQVGPFVSGSIMAQQMVFQAAHAAGFKVLLGGQGGDEAFMGYHKFQAFYLRSLLARKRYLDALVFAITLMPTFLAERAIWAESWRNRFRYSQSSGFGTRLRLPEAELMIGHSPLAALRDRQMLDVTLASLPTLLRYEDSNSMGNSIESRLPLLDYRLVEVGLALPESFKLRGGRGKWILREAAKQRIPESIRLARFKKGFDVQQNAWIEGGLGDRIRELLRGQLPTVGEFLAPGVEIEAVFSDTELKYRPSAFVEANTLLWIADSLQAA